MCGLAFELLMPQCVSWLILNYLYVFNSVGFKLCTDRVDKDAKSTYLKKSSQILGAMWPAKTEVPSQGRKREESGSKIKLMAALKKMTQVSILAKVETFECPHKKTYWQGISKPYLAPLVTRFPLTTVFPLFVPRKKSR